ncbi:unnamed protein product [Discosporangium mesarthrocarpum]
MCQKFVTYYEILGVLRSATTEEIDRAYRKASLQAHPDKGGDPAVFHRLKKAHEVLHDPKLRLRYDEYGPSLSPSSGHLIGAGTVGRLLPLAMSTTGCSLAQFLRTVGALGMPGWGLGCAVIAAATWMRGRQGCFPAVIGGVILGNATGLVLGGGVRTVAGLVLSRKG